MTDQHLDYLQFITKQTQTSLATKVLDDAWLLCQETQQKSDPIETNTVKHLGYLYSKSSFSELQMKMHSLRSKFLVGDEDTSLTFKAIQIYDDYIRFHLKSVEQMAVTEHVNKYLYSKQEGHSPPRTGGYMTQANQTSSDGGDWTGPPTSR